MFSQTNHISKTFVRFVKNIIIMKKISILIVFLVSLFGGTTYAQSSDNVELDVAFLSTQVKILQPDYGFLSLRSFIKELHLETMIFDREVEISNANIQISILSKNFSYSYYQSCKELYDSLNEKYKLHEKSFQEYKSIVNEAKTVYSFTQRDMDSYDILFDNIESALNSSKTHLRFYTTFMDILKKNL